MRVRNNTLPSLELRSVHRKTSAGAETGRWCTGGFASLKPELAILTHVSCPQEIAWDPTSYCWTRNFFSHPFMSPSQTGCSRVPTVLPSPFTRAGPLLGSRQPQWGHADTRGQGQDRRLGPEQGHRIVRPGEVCLQIWGKGLVMQTSGKTERGCSICPPGGSAGARSSSPQQGAQPYRSCTALWATKLHLFLHPR